MYLIFDFVMLGATGWLLFLKILQVIPVGILYILSVFYLVTVQNTLKAISPENRKLPPKKVWLALIPLFGFYWQYVIVRRATDSLSAEYHQKNIKVDETGFGMQIGYAYCTLFLISIIPNTLFGILIGIAGIICLIIYWSKLNHFKREM